MNNSNQLLSTDNLYLRAPEPEDLELMYRMENDTTLWSVGNTLLPYSRYTLKKYIANTKNDIYSEHQARFIIELSSGERIGMIDIVDFNPHDSRAEVCIGILNEYRGCGAAGEALQLLCRYALHFLGINHLYAYIPTDNEKSKNLFLKIGFSKTATLKAWKRYGEKFKDVAIFQLQKSDYLP